ncbi:MAG: hypothetical protein ACXVPY_11235, partial [Bacteroidia bacterium]
GIEYYGTTGTLNGFSPLQQQQHQLFAVLDLYNYNNLTFDFGYGRGFTDNTEKSVLKMILGWKFHDKSKI